MSGSLLDCIINCLVKSTWHILPNKLILIKYYFFIRIPHWCCTATELWDPKFCHLGSGNPMYIIIYSAVISWWPSYKTKWKLYRAVARIFQRWGDSHCVKVTVLNFATCCRVVCLKKLTNGESLVPQDPSYTPINKLFAGIIKRKIYQTSREGWRMGFVRLSKKPRLVHVFSLQGFWYSAMLQFRIIDLKSQLFAYSIKNHIIRTKLN